MTRISSYGSYLNTIRTVSGGQKNIDMLSEQLTTGKKATDVAFYGTQSQRLLDLKSEVVRRQAYSQTIEQTSSRVQSYNTIMQRMSDMATELASTTRIPEGPGAVRVSSVKNATSGAMQVSVDQTNSRFMAEATYTVSAVPSEKGPAGSFDVTVTDGLGGKATHTINLKQVPPQVDADRFTISGGPGDGAVIKLNVDKLEGPGTSSFDVSWPEMASTKEIIRGMTEELKSLLNERVGDRYIFAGSRYGTRPVNDLISAKQVSRVTLVGQRGDPGETYEMVLNGKRFSYTTTGKEQSLDEVLSNSKGTGIVDQIKAYNPPFNVTPSISNGIVTFTATDPKEKFTLTSAVFDNGTHANTIEPAPLALSAGTAPYTVQNAGETTKQVDNIKLHGPEADVGDVFNISIGARTIVQNEGAPEQVIIAGPTPYSYVISATDVDILNGTTPVPADAPGQTPSYTTPTSMSNWVAQRMAVQINADPAGTVVASIDPADDTNIILTAKENNSQFQTEASINNAGNKPMFITNTVPDLAEQDDFGGIVDPPGLPYYDTEYSKQQDSSAASDVANIQVDDGITVKYGVTSTDPAIQKLVSALRDLTAIVTRPGEYSTQMREVRDQLTDATGSLRAVQARVANAYTTIETVKTRHEEAITKASNELGDIQGIDENEVAVRLQATMNSQQTAYAVAGKLQTLSLINFLS